jgi:hypothetical protein
MAHSRAHSDTTVSVSSVDPLFTTTNSVVDRGGVSIRQSACKAVRSDAARFRVQTTIETEIWPAVAPWSVAAGDVLVLLVTPPSLLVLSYSTRALREARTACWHARTL